MDAALRVAVIVKTISGTGGRTGAGARRKAVAERANAAHGIEGAVFVTEYAGHARPLVAAALAAGASLVVELPRRHVNESPRARFALHAGSFRRLLSDVPDSDP